MDKNEYIALAPIFRKVAASEVARFFAEENDREDVVQDVMLRMWEQHAALEADVKRLKGYAVTLARNRSLDILKSRRRIQTYTTEHKEETYHFITNMKENSTRYNDYHLLKKDNEAKRICLLIVDDVKGPYLLPEEWYKITRYKYGKKKYLK